MSSISEFSVVHLSTQFPMTQNWRENSEQLSLRVNQHRTERGMRPLTKGRVLEAVDDMPVDRVKRALTYRALLSISRQAIKDE